MRERGWPEVTAELLSRSTFPGAGAPVACAVSGGPDSLAMLALAVAAGCEARAVHVDHGTRSTGGEEAAMVAAAAARLGVPFECFRVDVSPGPDLEARARSARYQALPEGVLIGHTADDQAETLLLNLLRGCGLDGLRGMRPDGAGLRRASRPILSLRRAETASFISALGLVAVTDPSNTDARFRRNRVRHEVLPLLASVAQRDPVPLLARTARLLADDAGYLEEEAAQVDPTDVSALRSAPRLLAARSLRQWLRQTEGAELHPPSSAELARAWEVVMGDVRACQLAGGRRLSRSHGRLSLSGPDAVSAPGAG